MKLVQVELGITRWTEFTSFDDTFDAVCAEDVAADSR